VEQGHDDKEISIGKKRMPEVRHRDRIRHGGDDGYGRDADRKIGGPRYLLGMGMDEKAVEMLKTWKFKPAQLSGHAIPMNILVQIAFRTF
jgi:hypothetical protein